MGEERYKILKTKVHKEWLAESSVKIDKSQLLLDTKEKKIILQIKMFNLGDKTIKSVYLDINCFDDDKNSILHLTDVAYIAVDAKPQSEFGDRQPVLLESMVISDIEIIISKVVFIDGGIWKNDDKNSGIILSEQQAINLNDAFYGQILREFKSKNIKPNYWYEMYKNYWRCTCGQANSKESLKCGYCCNEKEWLVKHLDKDYLTEEDKKFRETEAIHKKIEEENERNRIEQEKKRKIDDERNKILFKEKKRKRILGGVFVFALLTIVISIGSLEYYKKIYLPKELYVNKEYSRLINECYAENQQKNMDKIIDVVEQMINEDNYDEALTILSKLDRTIFADELYNRFADFIDTMNREFNFEYLYDMNEYLIIYNIEPDSTERIKNEYSYYQVLLLVMDNKYEDAVKAWKTLDDFADSKEKLEQTKEKYIEFLTKKLDPIMYVTISGDNAHIVLKFSGDKELFDKFGSFTISSDNMSKEYIHKFASKVEIETALDTSGTAIFFEVKENKWNTTILEGTKYLNE